MTDKTLPDALAAVIAEALRSAVAQDSEAESDFYALRVAQAIAERLEHFRDRTDLLWVHRLTHRPEYRNENDPVDPSLEPVYRLRLEDKP